MKRLVIFISACLMLAAPSLAQGGAPRPLPPGPSVRGDYRSSSFGRTYDSGDLYYGFRFGLAASHIDSDVSYIEGGHVHTGINVGFIFGTPSMYYSPVSFESGLYYINKGGSSSNKKSSQITYSLNYLEIPLLAKYNVQSLYDSVIQPFMGPYLAMGVGGEVREYSTRTSFSSFKKDYFRRFDAGLRIGVALNVSMFTIETGYDIGLANVARDSFDKIHNGCFFLNAGVTF